jgi:hypothetical protein
MLKFLQSCFCFKRILLQAVKDKKLLSFAHDDEDEDDSSLQGRGGLTREFNIF